MKLRNILLGIPLVLSMGCATIKPFGIIGTEYDPMKNEFKTEVKNGLVIPLTPKESDLKDSLVGSSLILGNSITAYKTMAEYNAFVEFVNPNFELSLKQVIDNEYNTQTKIGAKFKF